MKHLVQRQTQLITASGVNKAFIFSSKWVKNRFGKTCIVEFALSGSRKQLIVESGSRLWRTRWIERTFNYRSQSEFIIFHNINKYIVLIAWFLINVKLYFKLYLLKLLVTSDWVFASVWYKLFSIINQLIFFLIYRIHANCSCDVYEWFVKLIFALKSTIYCVHYVHVC